LQILCTVWSQPFSEISDGPTGRAQLLKCISKVPDLVYAHDPALMYLSNRHDFPEAEVIL